MSLRHPPFPVTLPMVVSGFVAVLVGYSSTGAIIYQAAQAAGAPPALIAGWFSVIGIAMGIASTGLSWLTACRCWPPGPRRGGLAGHQPAGHVSQ